jgi:hypothetical protein
MKSLKEIFVFTFCAVLFSVFSPNANPNPPTAYLMLSEVQVVDATHWSVEFLFTNRISQAKVGSDTFTYRYNLVYPGQNLSYRPKVPVSSNGYGLITQVQYPGKQFHPGDTVRLQMNTADTVIPGNPGSVIWQCIIPKNILPTESWAAYQKQSFIPYIVWCKNVCPNLGYPNNDLGIYGTIKGFVCDMDSQPLTNFFASSNCPLPEYPTKLCPSPMDSAGNFFLENILSTEQKTFSFPGKSATTFGPFTVEPHCTLSVVCKLNDYIPTSAHNAVSSSPASLIKIVAITKSKAGAIIVFNGSDRAEDYNVSIYSMNGKKVYASTVSCSGNSGGTYTVSCNTGIHAGTYIARVHSQSATVEQRFTVK